MILDTTCLCDAPGDIFQQHRVRAHACSRCTGRVCQCCHDTVKLFVLHVCVSKRGREHESRRILFSASGRRAGKILLRLTPHDGSSAASAVRSDEPESSLLAWPRAKGTNAPTRSRNRGSNIVVDVLLYGGATRSGRSHA